MSVRGAAVWAMVAQYASFAIQFASSVIISRFFMAPAEVGLFSIALAAALLVAILQDFGLSRYISGLAELDRDEVRRCSSVALLFSLAIAAAIAALAWPMAATYRQPDLGPILAIIAASYLFLPLSVVPMALMARTMQFHRLAAVNVGAAAIQAGVALTLAALGFSSFALAWATVAAGIGRGLIAQALRPAPPWPLRFDSLREVLSFGTRSSVLYLSGALGTRTPDLIVGKLLTLTAVGLYSRATSLSDQFRQLISGAIGSVMYPAFARMRDRGEPLGPAYLRVCAGYSAVIWPGMTGLALASEPIVRLLYGELWMGVAPLLAMIALTELMLVALPLVIDLPILLGKLNRLLALNLVDTLLSISLLAIGCLWGVEGAAASRLIYGAAWLCLYARFIHRLVGFDARALLAIYARSGAATLVAVTPLALAYLFWMPPATITFPVLLVAVALGVAGWFATLFIVRHPALDDLLGLAASLPVIRVIGRRLAALH
ncbi:oligosaccharide flippase family protein [Novosphingobium album (ex Liu et al. 2023)]|uniref:Oligosaccharide flippase family protein n=1 Tax=Novosphingobium album (ex Liu et al. 2023) TaxID=3031130 RepID=A0ABT5WSZ1_9SPHN|nr:oligosaccharide flippase family protein [Novosphingobium album (ex Liu et al. 2023)]MDE8653163.1 oligosaccharide flippase family protein [Novosphingobium album (ex Liu et al. 2023)]